MDGIKEGGITMNETESMSDCYPDGRFDGAFEHEGNVCPDCGKVHKDVKNVHNCSCGWCDF